MWRNARIKLPLHELSVITAIVGAASVLLLACCCYVAGRLVSKRAYRRKWQDYSDCGWA